MTDTHYDKVKKKYDARMDEKERKRRGIDFSETIERGFVVNQEEERAKERREEDQRIMFKILLTED
jgi:hypothetical protein